MEALLPRWNKTRFLVDADNEMLARLECELLKSDYSMGPASWWELSSEYTRGSMETMLDPWCGPVGKLSLRQPELIAQTVGDDDFLPEVMKFALGVDYFDALTASGLSELAQLEWRVFDLFSFIDLSLISAFSGIPLQRPRVLEVGGGFGRLAEFSYLSLYHDMVYVNVDAVPVSLMYSYLYLKEQFPTKQIHLLFSNQTIPDEFDILIVPSWNIDVISHLKFDLAVNIESFQEMNGELVASYFRLFDGSVKDQGAIFLVNSREYKNKVFPAAPQNWECVLKHRTVRSWTNDHPVEIFKKGSRDSRPANKLRNLFYARELTPAPRS